MDVDELKEELYWLLLLDEFMRKDPLYQNRCDPRTPRYVENNWNKLQLRIINLEEKIRILSNNNNNVINNYFN
jgi:hypothetical protein